jgi:hypothetical protein
MNFVYKALILYSNQQSAIINHQSSIIKNETLRNCNTATSLRKSTVLALGKNGCARTFHR